MKIYIFGLGHVGLPLACFAAMKGHQVIGIDTNPEAIKAIENGEINIYEYYEGTHISDLAQNLIQQGSLNVTNSFNRAEEEEGIFLISVGIYSSENFVQDLSPIEDVMNTLVPKLKANDLIIFRTTLIPGTIDKYVLPRVENLKIPVHLAYCPETLVEGYAFEELSNNPMIIAGKDDESFNRAKNFFNTLSKAEIYKASNIKTAELVKVVENISRDVNVALINELSEGANALNVDIYEIQKLANTHPRIKLLTPGAGVGGYCLPNALAYLKEALKYNNNISLPLTSMARICNLMRPSTVVEKLQKILNSNGKELSQCSIAVIGLAMKDNCADCKYSPAIEIVKILLDQGAGVKAYDPVVGKKDFYQVESFNECIRDADCVLITAVQSTVKLDKESIVNSTAKPPIVFDTRNCFSEYTGIKLYKL